MGWEIRPDRKFEFRLYPDATNYDCNNLLLKLQRIFNEWAYILHDMDLDDNGNLVKPHFHFYGRGKNVLTGSSILYSCQLSSDDDNILSSIRNVKSWKSCIRYLIHYDYPEKHIYSVDDIVSNFDVLPFFKENLNEAEQAKMIIDYLMSHDKVSEKELFSWVFANNLWTTYRRGYSIFHNIIKEGFH